MKCNKRMIEAVGVQSLTDRFSIIEVLLPATDGRIDSHLTKIDTPSIAVANYNVQHTVISNKHSPIEPLLPNTFGKIVSQPTSCDFVTDCKIQYTLHN